jgi:hypothetical protein
MKALSSALAVLCASAFSLQTECQADTVIDADFSKGDFAALGWTVKGDWDEFQYPREAAINPGRVAQFAANKPAGSAVRFNDSATTSFSQLVLLGTKNFDEQVFKTVVLTTTGKEPVATTARPTSDFLNSIGVDTTFPDRGQPLAKTVEMINYCGFRWVRGGIEGLTEHGATTVQTYLDLHHQTGVRFNWGLGSGGADLPKLIITARQIAAADSLLAFEGNNEPNNWGVTYQVENGGGHARSWLAVAKLQRDLYSAVKRDPVLKQYPVWSISESGAESDNVGLQFLTIPSGAGTEMPEGTKYADYANCHNYIYHPGSAGLSDNKTWNAADSTSVCKVDGLFSNYGRTWARHFRGYSEDELLTKPGVATETGRQVGEAITEGIHALNLLNLYLDQFKRGWSYTSVYILRDRTDEGGNPQFGFYRPDYTPRKAAVYLHNLTTILSDNDTLHEPGKLAYAIAEEPVTVHDMLFQNSSGIFQLIIWGERLKGEDRVTVRFGRAQSSVDVYDPTVGTQPVRTLTDADSLELTLSDHPLIIELTKAAK